MLLGGHIGRPGAGVCPVRGHSNVQGDRTMGIWEKMPDRFLDKLRDTFGFEPPRKHGWDVVDSIKAMHRGEAKVFFAMGGNFLSATPDTEYTAQALSRCQLTVHVSTKLNRAHLITGEPGTDLAVSGAHGSRYPGWRRAVCHRGKLDGHRAYLARRPQPPSEQLMSEPAIVAHLAVATFHGRSRVDWLHLIEDYDRIRDLISQVVPGCEEMNQKVRQPGGFYFRMRPGTISTGRRPAKRILRFRPSNPSLSGPVNSC